MSKKTYISTLVMLTIILFSIVAFTALRIVPARVISFCSPKYEVLTPVVKAGEFVEYRIELIKYKEIPGTVSRMLVNSYIYTLTPTDGNLPIGPNNQILRIPIPNFVEPGLYYINTVYKYPTNFGFRTEVYSHNTETFEIIK